MNSDDKLSYDARQKMSELLVCGNERVELAAAKEIIAEYNKSNEAEDKNIHLTVTIKVI